MKNDILTMMWKERKGLFRVLSVLWERKNTGSRNELDTRLGKSRTPGEHRNPPHGRCVWGICVV